MIRANNLVKRFSVDGPAVINHLSVEIRDGDFISLVGRSGSGKSTLLYLISTLDRTFEGEVFYDQDEVRSMDVNAVHALRNRQIGFVFQFHYLINELTALENILLPARKAGILKQKLAFAKELLQTVGLAEKAERFPPQLSGGEQQRVAIARALLMQPKYLFADEPTGNLDIHNGDAVMELFSRFNHEFKTTIVYVTHDREFAKRAKRQIELVDGQIVRDEKI
ncbi:MAG: ABC transporter ATP-binding protein [Oligoflexales bacterium]|nr:ABC transporter ATP-binding protein [Oligoflexales bacterium]